MRGIHPDVLAAAVVVVHCAVKEGQCGPDNREGSSFLHVLKAVKKSMEKKLAGLPGRTLFN